MELNQVKLFSSSYLIAFPRIIVNVNMYSVCRSAAICTFSYRHFVMCVFKTISISYFFLMHKNSKAPFSFKPVFNSFKWHLVLNLILVINAESFPFYITLTKRSERYRNKRTKSSPPSSQKLSIYAAGEQEAAWVWEPRA